MKTIRNVTTTPLRITLPGGKVLHLGPKKTGQIAGPAVDHHSVQELIKAKKLEVLGEGEHGVSEPGHAGPRPRSTQGQQPRNKAKAGGDR